MQGAEKLSPFRRTCATSRRPSPETRPQKVSPSRERPCILRRSSDRPVLSVALFGSFGDGKVIDDPYCASLKSLSSLLSLTSAFPIADGGPNGFEKTYQQCVQYSEGLLKDMGYGSEGGKL